MQIGVMNHPAQEPIAEIEWIGQNGFDFVDFTLEPPAADPDQIDPDAIRDALDRHKLGVVAHTAWFLPLGSPFTGILFWGWLWGAWGMLLAVPLMTAIKAICARVEQLNPIAQLGLHLHEIALHNPEGRAVARIENHFLLPDLPPLHFTRLCPRVKWTDQIPQLIRK